MAHKKKTLRVKSILSFLLSKVFIVGFLIILQIVFLLVSVFLLADQFSTVYGLLNVLSLCIVIWLVPKEENPSYKLAWVILIMALPIFGGLFYLLFGNKGLPKMLLSRVRQAVDHSEKMLTVPEESPSHPALAARHPHLDTMARYIERTTFAPLCEHTQAEYFGLGEQMWHRMLEELPKAQKFIFLEYFILEEGLMWDPILEILAEKASQGLDVRLMYDDIGSINTLPAKYAKKIRALGIRCTVFNPFQPHLNSMMNYRDHRKILVIDGNVGFSGGINMADEYINAYEKYGHWKDTGVMLRGEGVWNLTAMFLALWNFSTPTDTKFECFRPTLRCETDGFVQAFGDNPLDRINVCEDTYMQIINRATRYVYITTPYLILDNEMVTTLQTAARSGVDVRIVTPGIPDKWFVHQTSQSFYQVLLDAGVRIYEYTPGFVHAKMYVSDDNVAIVGTANMDFRSFYLHFECGICFYDSSVIADVHDDIVRMLDACSEVPRDYIRHVNFFKRILRACLRLFSPMM